jgi:diguanylate cyclase
MWSISKPKQPKKLSMKLWMKKLADEFGLNWPNSSTSSGASPQHGTETPTLHEGLATLLHVIDSYSKHLLEVDGHPPKQVRQEFAEIAVAMTSTDPITAEKGLFRLRQYFTSYRIAEANYLQKTFDDFKNVIWDFADQLAEALADERSQDREMQNSLGLLRDAVEANSIEELRRRSREFIDFYVSFQAQKDSRRTRRLENIQKNLETVKQKLNDANHSAMTDHLTGAANRRAFEETARTMISSCEEKSTVATLLTLDIDHFKKINDTYGHDIGDFVLKEFVRVTRDVFNRDKDIVARIGGEEFCVLLPNLRVADAIKKTEGLLERYRKEAIVTNGHTVRFTASVGIAQWTDGETVEQWLKRADDALYSSKHNGRNQFTVAPFAAGVRVA